MSIATSVVVQPSRILSLSLVVMGLLLLTTATLLVSFPADDSGFVFRQLLILLCAAAAITSFLYAARYRKIFFIDISGNGVIHLRQSDQTKTGSRSANYRWAVIASPWCYGQLLDLFLIIENDNDPSVAHY